MGAVKSYIWIAGFLVLAAGLAHFLMLQDQRPWSYMLMASGGAMVASGIALNSRELIDLMRGRTVRYGANAVLYSLIVLLILGSLNFLASRHRARIDLTRGGAHTLAPQTVELLEGLKVDVEIIAFYTRASQGSRQEFEDLVEEYRYHTDRLKVRVVDPVQSPGEANLHEVVQDGTVVLLAGEGKARMSQVSEQALTNAIMKATRAEVKTVCFTTGHGEGRLSGSDAADYGNLAAALRRETYETRDVLLLREPGVPTDCQVVVVAGPASPLHPGEAQAIGSYLEAGGRLLVMKRNPKASTGLDELLAGHGLVVNSDTVVDRLSRAIIGDEFSPVVTAYDTHPVTRALLESGTATYFPVASSVEAVQAGIEGVSSVVLARTSEAAWGETGEVARFQEGEDRAGPLGLVAAASGRAEGAEEGKEDPERRIVLFGDSDFASNGFLGMSGNIDLFMNSVGWLAEEEDLLSIRPREKSPQPVTLTQARANVLSGMTYLAPMVALVGAILAWSQRKKL